MAEIPSTARMDTTVQPFTALSLGQRILLLRESSRLSLRTLAKQVDLSASFLSQIERDETSPSISSLEKIAQALRVDISHFFLKSHPVPVLKQAQQNETSNGGVTIRQLSNLDSRVNPYTVQLDGRQSFSSLVSRNELFLYVTHGCISVSYENKTEILEEGDAFHLTFQTPWLVIENKQELPSGFFVVDYM